jgi:pyrroloquinoline quinone biosynthesis protein B
MKIRVLGSCAGGGLPQWNCGGTNSVRARAGDPAVPAQTQPSIAVSADGERWSILNASPDIRDQLAHFPGLHPREGTRDVPLDTLVLTSAELDHAIGLLVLREALSYRVLSTPWVRQHMLEHNSAWRLLERAWGTAGLDAATKLDRDGMLEARFFPVAPKVPGYLKDVAKPHAETTVGVRITDNRSGARLAFVPGLKTLDSATLAELAAADCRFVDGTFFTEDELRELRPGAASATAMGHAPITGPEGTLAPLAELPGRTLYIHMNNTNPILDLDSPETARVTRTGVEIARDGLEFEL